MILSPVHLIPIDFLFAKNRSGAQPESSKFRGSLLQAVDVGAEHLPVSGTRGSLRARRISWTMEATGAANPFLEEAHETK